MMATNFRHYRALAEQLSKHVDADTQAALLAGMDGVTNSSKPEIKAAWAREMMRRMDHLLKPETRIIVREGCACLLSNEKSIYARTFRKLRRLYPDDDDRYLDEVVAYLNSTAPLRRCGEVTRTGDRITSVIAHGACSCSALREGLREPISVTWCHCCKGSLLSVYRHVFPDRTCAMEIVGTVATGAEECCFVTEYR
jgi:hypothetical protein